MDRMDRKEAISAIRFLSYSLYSFTGVVEQGRILRPNGAAEKENRNLSLFLHLATILNTGSPASLIPAVTGQITAEGIKATVVISSISTDPCDKFDTDYLITDVKPSQMTWDGLLEPSA